MTVLLVVTLKVGGATMKRPITKVCPFPKDEVNNAITVNHVKITRTRNIVRKHGVNVLPIITAILAVFCTLTHARSIVDSEPFELVPFEKPTGLFFENTSNAFVATSYWNLIAAIDLRKFNEMFEHFEQRMDILKTTCEKRFDDDKFCNEWIDTLNAKIDDLHDRFELITSSRSRKKKSRT